MKVYYNQEKIASNLRNFFKKVYNLSKPHLKVISYIITGMISAESVVTSDISRKLKDDFSLVNIESIERRFRRFFNSFSYIAYYVFDSLIVHVISNTQKIEHFISLFTIMCIALIWLTILGVDYVKSKHKYHLKIRDIRRFSDNTTSRRYSFFNLGLTIFNRCYYNFINFTLRFDFVLYDV